MSPLPGNSVIPYGMRVPVAVWHCYPYFTLLYLIYSAHSNVFCEVETEADSEEE